MNSDRTFYINYESLQNRKDKIHDDYWKEIVSGDRVWEKLYDVSGTEEPDLVFKKFKIVIMWFEYSDECVRFRNLLDKYKIEYVETM